MNKYESVFFIPWTPVNFHINRGDFLLKIRGGPGPLTRSMGWSMNLGPCFVYVHFRHTEKIKLFTPLSEMSITVSLKREFVSFCGNVTQYTVKNSLFCLKELGHAVSLFNCSLMPPNEKQIG